MRPPRSVAVALCLCAAGCFWGFKHPLGPVKSAFIEPRLLGTWQCSSTEDPKPGRITIIDFDGKQYYFGSLDDEGKTSHSRVHATRVGGVPYLSSVEVGKEEDGWFVVRYEFPDQERLHLRFVDPKPFEQVLDNPGKVRKLLERRRNDPTLFLDVFLSCVREPVPDTVETRPPGQ